MSPAMSPPPRLLISSLLLLILLIAGDSSSSSAAAVPVTDVAAAAARLLNKARKAKEASEYLYAHNAARAAHGVPKLRWDVRLTRVASEWAKQRQGDCKLVHSGGPYGENMFWSRRAIWSPTKIVAQWAGERSHYNPKSNSCAAGAMCGHYTQVVWQTTTAVGCATVKCDNNAGYIAVCEYNPPGNYEGERPFLGTNPTANDMA